VTEPELLTVSEALQAIRRRELGVAELTGALLERIARIEPQVDAWELVDAEGALAAARHADANFARLASLPLFGVPVGLKDIYFTRGLVTTAGFPPWAQQVPDHDAATVERLRQAGAIILGKTVTTQFAFADPPRTRNPWDRERTPGGSSSGSAAAVAARLVPLALGSQTAGSILRPAAYCGVYGLKPTYGLVSRFGIVPLAWTLDHPGPLARSVEDLARALAVLAGPDPRDSATARAQVGDYLAAIRGPGRAPTVGVLEDVVAAADRPVQKTFISAIDALVWAGARVKELRLPTELPTLAAAQQTIMQVEAAEVHARLHREHAESYGPRMRALIEIGQLVPAQLYVRANRIRQRFRAEVAALLSEVDCLALPTASNLAPSRETTGDRTFQAPWSLIGVPAITLPAGVAEGLPVGLQLVAGPWQEASLLAAARWAEGVLPPLGLPPTSPGSGRN
jgi:aspartyl-tRNA(Asn)/glutamyl-tRNA(Gln) amidotransferase subunit A